MAAVKALAGVLLQKQKLTGTEATDIIKQAIREAIATCSKEDMAIAKICPHCEEDKNEEWGAD